MTKGLNLDGIQVTWGDRLFYPGNRMVRSRAQPKLSGDSTSRRAAAIRSRIEATVLRRAPQVMVKVTGGGRGMRAIAAHFRYISKNGRLEVEDDRGEKVHGPNTVCDLAEEWKHSGGQIPDEAGVYARREAFNVMLSMPRGTDPLAVQRAARVFARAEFADHKYVMVLHDHQANPHVHISVRAESRHGRRLNPRKSDLHRWRATFADRLRELGIDAEASGRPTRGRTQSFEPLWRVKAREEGRLRSATRSKGETVASEITQAQVVECWTSIAAALGVSGNPSDSRLAGAILEFVKAMPVNQSHGLSIPPPIRAATLTASRDR